jgi:hypothetical protein
VVFETKDIGSVVHNAAAVLRSRWVTADALLSTLTPGQVL